MTDLYLSDENLMAYADGQADQALVSAIEAAMFTDAEIVARIAAFIRSRRIARALFPQAEPVDLALVDAVLAAAEEQQPAEADAAPEPANENPRPARRIALPLAAALALCIGAGAIVYGLRAPPPGGLALLEGRAAGNFLDTALSGATTSLASSQLRIVATQRLADGRLCREIRLDAPERSVDAVNCRDNSGRWPVTIALSEPQRQGYAPAKGDNAIDLFLKNSRAGPALSGEAERQAISGDGKES
jgi:anti-sigma factor RsiW